VTLTRWILPFLTNTASALVSPEMQELDHSAALFALPRCDQAICDL
jgi:hypothetical protein